MLLQASIGQAWGKSVLWCLASLSESITDILTLSEGIITYFKGWNGNISGTISYAKSKEITSSDIQPWKSEDSKLSAQICSFTHLHSKLSVL